MIGIFAFPPYLVPLVMVGVSTLIAIFCLIADPKDQHNASFAGLVVAAPLFCINFHFLWKAVVIDR